MSSSFRTPGAPSAIESNVTGTGMVMGDQLGDQLPGVLASLQESPEASKTSCLYYKEDVGAFHQPSFQRSFGALNLPVPINKFGDSGSVEINPDIYWKGPLILSTTFTIPYKYYGPLVYRSQNAAVEPNQTWIWNETFWYGDTQVNPGDNNSNSIHRMENAVINSRPQLFYSWGAAYANLRNIRLNMGGALSYVIDHYSNFVGVMASCVSLNQRAALMKASGSGVMIPDEEQEKNFGISNSSAEYGSIPLYGGDGGIKSISEFNATQAAYGLGVPSQVGPPNACVPLIEHWNCVIKTPHTNFNSMVNYRRPIDTRLFSSNFVIDFFTAPNLDSFVDTGLGYQPVLMHWSETASTIETPPSQAGLLINGSRDLGIWQNSDGLFPSMVYRQLFIPNAALLNAYADNVAECIFNLANTDVQLGGYGPTQLAKSGANQLVPQMTPFYCYRLGQGTTWKKVLLSKGYKEVWGGDPVTEQPKGYLNQDNFAMPQYNTVINSLRLANDQLGAKQVLETRPDLCVYYPFQHFTSQIYRVNQYTTSTGNTPYNPVTYPNGITAFTNTNAGGSGYGAITQSTMMTFQTAPYSYQIPMTTAISIPNNPLTCLYIMVMREKDRQNLGYSTPYQYSPVLYWNALELQAFSLTYSAQVLQKYNNHDEYLLQQIHERCEPLVVPFRGGPVTRSDLLKTDPQTILNSAGYPGCWYNSYIYEFCMVDQLPLKNEAFFQQTPGFRGEMLNFNFYIKPTLRSSWSANDFDLRSNTGFDTAVAWGTAPYVNTYNSGAAYTNYLEKLAFWCPGIPTAVCSETSTNWNLNNDNLMVVCVFAQNALWQLNPLNCKCVFARGA